MSTPLRRCVPVHSATGEKWRSHSTIKKHLQQDFNGRCAYCDDPDSLVDVDFQIEHFAPQAKFPERKIVYQNLLYACAYCNGAKSVYWVSDDPDVNVRNDEGVVNPCTKDYDLHLGRLADGRIFPKTKLGEFMYMRLKLYLLRHESFFRLERLRDKIKELKLSGVGTEIIPLYEELNEYYQSTATVKRKAGKILRCVDMRKTSPSKEASGRVVVRKRAKPSRRGA